MIFERLFEDSKNMAFQDKLRHHFMEFIRYFNNNLEYYAFTNYSLFFIPQELREKLHEPHHNYFDQEKHYHKKLQDIIMDGIQQGIICEGNPEMKLLSFKAKRDGLLGLMRVLPKIKEECMEQIWNDFWFGVMEYDDEV